MQVMSSLRAYLTGVVVLALVLTSQAMAVARGMPGAAGYAEYCLNNAPVMVPVDAEGNPTGPPHICPDFSLSLLDHLGLSTATPRPVAQRSERLVVWHAVSIKVIRRVPASARAPPMIS